MLKKFLSFLVLAGYAAVTIFFIINPSAINISNYVDESQAGADESPGFVQTYILIEEENNPLKFSHEGGWYGEDFDLHLYTYKNAEIYYTIDGSEPTTKSKKYTEPIRITAKTGKPQYYPPKKDVFMATVVRAMAVTPDGKTSKIITHTYFIDPLKNERFKMPVISISTNPEHFFDYYTGIYVPGRIYDINGKIKNIANFTQRGREWERPGHIEFYENDGTLGFSQNVGFRIHGNYSREHAQRPLRIYARSEYDPRNVITHEIFPGLKDAEGKPLVNFKRLVLRNSGNDWFNTMTRDALMQQLVSDTRIDKMASRASIVFINGEYWGIFNIREIYDRFYFKYKYGIEDDIVILELNARVDYGEPGDEKHYNDMISYLKINDIRQERHYEYIKTLMDVDNFIDYSIAQIYFANNDYPGNNIKFWRVKTDRYIEGAGVADGRWRWLIYDTDFGFNLATDFSHNTLKHATEEGRTEWPNPDWSTFLLRTLLKNEEFKQSFINRFADLLNSDFHPDRVLDVINGFEELYGAEIEEHINRWGAIPSVSQWKMNMKKIKDFASKRPDWLYRHIKNFFNIESVNTLEIESDYDMGYVGVNSIIIDENTKRVTNDVYPWTGQYFSDVPVMLTAYPREGYKFVRWSGLETKSPTVTIKVNKDMKIGAVFEKIEYDASVKKNQLPLWIIILIAFVIVSGILFAFYLILDRIIMKRKEDFIE